MAEFGTAKTVFILAIVVGCFAILWPKIFYPMLLTSLSMSSGGGSGGAGVGGGGGAHVEHTQDTPLDNQGNNCCDVIFETDVTAIKVLTAMCGDILHENQVISSEQLHLTKASVVRCRDEVLSACGLDITAVIKDQTGLTKDYRQILDEIRSFNNSACLKHHFGIELSLIGTPRRMRYFPERYFRDKTTTARHLRPERPAHLHPEMMHPALREKGRAIPQRPITVASATGMDGSAPRQAYPIPGMRPPLGGAGHVVPSPKGSGTMGIIMPLYTVGIVVFFVYTIMKMLFKKQDDRNKSADFGMDPEIRQMMFGAAAMEECAVNAHHTAQCTEPIAKKRSPEPTPVPAPAAEPPVTPASATTNGSATSNGIRASSPPKAANKLGWDEHDTIVTAITGLLAEVDQHFLASEAKNNLKTAKGDEEEEQTQTVDDIIVDQHVVTDKVVADEVIEKENIEATKEEVSSHITEEVAAEVGTTPEEDAKPEELDEEEPLEDEPLEEEIAKVTGDEPEEEVKETLSPTNGHLPERCTTPLQQLLEEGGGKVTVLTMETTARSEDGQKMARPPTPSTPPRSITPILPLYALEQFTPAPAYRWSRPATPTSMTPPRSSTPLQRPVSATPPPTHGYMMEAGYLPGGHGILVADSECEATPVGDLFDYDDLDLDEEAPPVILSGKMTLSVINLPEAIAAEAAAAAAAAASSGHQRTQLQTAHLVEATDETSVLHANGVEKSDVNGADEVSLTNYTTASAALVGDGTGQEETSADVSGMDDQAEAEDIDEPAAEIEELPRDDASARHNQSNGLQ